jgi:hypothetical protein
MRPELNLTNKEKMKIGEWKHSLPQNQRKFIYAFIESGKFTDDGYKLYNYVIKTDDKFSLVVSENVELC